MSSDLIEAHRGVLAPVEEVPVVMPSESLGSSGSKKKRVFVQ